MKSLVVCIILGIVAQGYAFQCDAMFSGRVCGKYVKTQKSLENAVRVADASISKALTEIAKDTAALYAGLLPTLGKLSIKNHVIRLDKNTVIHVHGNMSAEDVKLIMNNMLEWLKTLSQMGMIDTEVFTKMANKIEEALKNILNTGSAAYANDDVKVHIETIKQKLREALQGVNSLVKTLILKAVDRVQGHYDRLSEKIGSIMELMGYKDKWLQIKSKIDAVLTGVRGKVGTTATNNAQMALLTAEMDVLDLFDEIGKEKPIVKRGIADVWNKVKSAVKDLGDKISEATKKVIDQYKPKIVEALNGVKKVFIDGGKKIIIEINGQIVKILTDGATGTSE